MFLLHRKKNGIYAKMSLVYFLFRGYRSHQIQSVSSPDGGSAPRDDVYSPEFQQGPGQLDEPQRQIPSEDLVS